ncbi:MAG: SRPBCC family protein [Nocardiopsaceae bacterium]|nr:SRPBCC family protein [Nocardiopsaceae bacterium]
MISQLTIAPSVDVGVLVRRPPHDVFEALADPSITTRFWYTKSTGRMAKGAELTWKWEMYGALGKVWVEEAQPGRRIRFSWEGYDPAHPTTVEFQFIPHENDTTYVRITETGFTGDADTQVSRALESTAGFTFLLSSLKAALEHDITLRVTMDAHPPNLQPPGLDDQRAARH